MTQITPLIHGIYPRSADVVEATRDLDRGRTDKQTVDTTYAEQEQDVIQLQEQLGLPYVTNGQLQWQDYFRPIIEATDGLEEGELTRFFDTNTFYRSPSPGREDVPAVRELDPAYVDINSDRKTTLTLPGPAYLFHCLAEDVDDETALDLLPNIYDQVYQSLGHIDLVQYTEPYLAFNGLDKTDHHILENFDQYTPDNAETLLHFPHGDITEHLSELEDVPVDILGVDAITKHQIDHSILERLVNDLPKSIDGIYLGVVDGWTSWLEDPEDVAEEVRPYLNQLDVDEIFVGTDKHLDLIPYEDQGGETEGHLLDDRHLANRKVETVARVADILER